MTLKLYKNSSDKIVVDKSITQVGQDISGTLRDACSVIDPVIAIEGLSDLTVNYAYISEFNRYYYINNIVCKGPLFELHMHVDVLKTYASGIRSNKGVIARQQNEYNLYLTDGVFKTESIPHYEIRQFPSGFSGYHFILAVAGA